MVKKFVRIEYQVSAQTFVAKSGQIFDKSVQVVFLDAQSAILGEETFGYLQATDLYPLLFKNNPILAENAFVDGFSIAEYRKLYGYEPDSHIIIKGISAKSSLWYNPQELDLSGISFVGELNFDETRFVTKSFNCSACHFHGAVSSFEHTVFCADSVDFSHSTFAEGLLSFKNAIFSSAPKNFENCNFAYGKIVFINVDFGHGDVTFCNTHFEGGLINFRVANFGTGRIGFQKAHFGSGEIIFEGVNFGDGEVSFRSAVFVDNKLNLMRSHFGEGDKLFVNTNFGNGNLSFVNANLGKGLVSFKLAIMGTGKKDFHFCTHTGDMIFERCIMGSGPIDLRAIDFTQGKMSFTRTELGNVELNFDGANFVDYRIIFKYTSFTQGSVIMSNVTAVGCNLSFENLKLRNTDFTLNRSQFARVSLTSSQLDSYIDLRLAQCNYLDLSDSVIRDIVDMIPEGSPVIIQHLNLKGVRLLGKLYADWHLNNIAYLIYNQEHTNYETKAEQFRMLKENYSNIGQYENEDHAYLEFKRCEAKTILNTAPSNTIKTLGNRFLFAFRWLLFDKMGHYATSPVRVLVSMAVAYTLFSFIYILEGMFTGSQIVSSLGDPDHLNIWQRSFYHSAVTFFTIGYGDYYPSGLARFVSALEGFVGLFMMSYFTVAFVRKIIR